MKKRVDFGESDKIIKISWLVSCLGFMAYQPM